LALRATRLAVTTCWLALLAGIASAAAQDRPSGGSPAREGVAVATDARLSGDGKTTRLVVDLSRKVDMRAFTLADPYRVVVDLPEVNFQLPAKIGEHGHGLVKEFRFGLVMQGGSRIVLDASGPVRIEKASAVDATGDQPARLLLELVAVDRASFLRTIAVENRAAVAREPKRSNDRAPAGDDVDPRPVVVIDPGHGGIDNGTQAPSGENEKDLVLEFALMLRSKIEKTNKYRVVMTRSDDTFVPLGERVRMARSHQAQLFISIHCDALARGDGEAQGATVYTLSETASDIEAGKLAEQENKADVIAGVDLSAEPNDIADILIDLAQRETKIFSLQFARDVVSDLKRAARMHKHPMKSAGFRVLTAPDVPSVLVELGYVSDKSDLKQLTSDGWRGRAAETVVQAVDTFFTTRLAGANPAARRN
jgi:N-acetylmuramoyl-L-alanine amidase